VTQDQNNGEAKRRAHWLKLFLGWTFLVLGIAGLVLPFLQGILFIAIGLWLLSHELEWAHRKREWLLNRFPQMRPRVLQAEAYLDACGARIRDWLRRQWS